MINPNDYYFSIYIGETGLESLTPVGTVFLIIGKSHGDGSEDPELEEFLEGYGIFAVTEDTFETSVVNAKGLLVDLGFIYREDEY